MKTTNRNTTRARLLASALAMLLCVAMLAGTTFAWFSDEAKTGDTKITAGNLDVGIVDESGNSLEEEGAKLFDIPDDFLWEPGAMWRSQPFAVKNSGSLALQYKLDIALTNADTNEGLDLGEVIQMKVVPAEIDGVTPPSATEATQQQRLDYWNQIEGKNAATNGVILPSTAPESSEEELAGRYKAQTPNLVAVLYWKPTDSVAPDNTDNEYNLRDPDAQPLSATFTLDVLATQVPYESDSFGIEYDRIVPVNSQDALVDALEHAQDGDDLQLGSGSFELPQTNGEDNPLSAILGKRDITFSGEGEETVLVIHETEKHLGEVIEFADNKTVKFENLTIDGTEVQSGILDVYGEGTLELDGVKMIGGGDTTYDSSIVVTGDKQPTGLILKNSYISGAFRAVQFAESTADSPADKFVVENCTLEAPYTFNVMSAPVEIDVHDSILQGGTSYDNFGKPVVFDSVTFCRATEMAVPWSGRGEFRPLNKLQAHRSTTLRNCTFMEGFWMNGQEKTFTYTIENCQKTNFASGELEKVTKDNVIDLFLLNWYRSDVSDDGTTWYVRDNKGVSLVVDGEPVPHEWTDADYADGPAIPGKQP